MLPSSEQKNLGVEYRSNANTIYVGEKPNSISFSGCGFLGMYHIGVASCLKMHAPTWVKNIDRVYGCSIGSLVGAMLLNDVCFGEVCQRMMNIVKDLRSRYLGPFSPGFKLNETLMRDIQNGLPEDAHMRASGKLFISLTRFPDGHNVIVSDYKTRDELIQVLLCSCFVPFYSGLFPPTYRGVRYVDGGLSNNLPAFNDTITVSPWSGSSDICPRSDGAENLVDLHFVNTSIQVTASNFYRISTMFYPPNPDVLRDFCGQGFRETIQYLRDNALFETKHPLRKNMSFSSLLHKVEDRRKITRRLSFTAQRLQKQDSEKLGEVNKESSDLEQTGKSQFFATGTSKIVEECFSEDEDIDHDVLMPLNMTNEAHRNVFTVVQVYPVLVDDQTIRLQFQLPSVMLDALDASLEGKPRSWKRPVSKILSTCRRSIVVQVPLEKTYAISCFIIRHSASLPNDLAFATRRLRLLILHLHQHFKCSGEKLFVKLSSLKFHVQNDIVYLINEIATAVQIIVKALYHRSIPLHTALLMLLSRNNRSYFLGTDSQIEIV